MLTLFFASGQMTLFCGENLRVTTSEFSLQFDPSNKGITSLKRSNDVFDTEYIKKDHILGDMMIHYRINNSDWKKLILSEMQNNSKVELVSKTEYKVVYSLGDGLELTKHLILQEGNLVWTMQFKNNLKNSIEIADIALPLKLNTDYVAGSVMDEDAVRLTYENRLNRHRLIAGHGSFIYWMRANGVGPYLVMTPLENTKLEYFDRDYVAYINSAYTGGNETRGTWRQKHTSTILAPNGQKGDAVNYGFTFSWGKDYDGVRDVLYKNGSFDVNIVPGMVLPDNLTAKFSLRTRNQIKSVVPEYPDQTELEYLGEKEEDIHIYQVKFSKLGENLLTVNYNDGRFFILEFFCTEPLETLYKKRAKFITEKQQHRNDKWYNGLFSLWDMKKEELLGPENRGGLYQFQVEGADDPCTGKPIFLSEKNVVYPDPKEIAALEYFIEHFVWGNHQRTDKEEPHPYGIYGTTFTPGWYENRHSDIGFNSGGHGQEHMWRTFDYTHYILLYYNMYRIAKQYPHLVNYLDASGYLERAYGTARAFFLVPYNIKMGEPYSFRGWCDWAYKLGNFHEKYIVDVIDACYEEGLNEEADWLKNEWVKKVKYFIYDDPSPFGSEGVFDRTAFESTYAIARYAIENPLKPDKNLWYDKNLEKWYSHPKVEPQDAYDFMGRQINANIAMRGWLETTYFYLGSAVVGIHTLDYMSQMAGWSILDYALNYSSEPAKYARLGFASILSSWALLNSGTPESNYGYWYPGKGNDGAVGWSFKTEKYGPMMNRLMNSRGPHFIDGEIDHGLTEGVRGASTIVIEDPLFDDFAYGGNLKMENERYYIIPRDGVRRQLHFKNTDHHFKMILDTDGFLKEQPIVIKVDLTEIDFRIENRSSLKHKFKFSLSGLPLGNYDIYLNGKVVSSIGVKDKVENKCKLEVGGNDEYQIGIRLNKN
jgi:hypothetical protein